MREDKLYWKSWTNIIVGGKFPWTQVRSLASNMVPDPSKNDAWYIAESKA